MAQPSLTILLASPRSFCAGVERAILIVEKALDNYGPPVYVRHEIVHNRFVVESLKAKGAVFVDELDEVPEDAPVVFSAHGVAKSVRAQAERRNLFVLDATCPLVSKVHSEAEHHFAVGRQIILIGHAGHPEVEGTMGQLPQGAVMLVENLEQAKTVEVERADRLAFITQTTLAVDDVAEIIDELKRRFPSILAPKKEDICYATSNRQQAVKAIAAVSDAMIVIGAPNSSNSMRLVEVALQSGCDRALLVQRAADVDWGFLDGIERLGLTAGASAPDILVEELIDACRACYDVTLEEVTVTRENVHFNLPRALSA